MPHSFDEIRKLAHALPEGQRIELANSLYESVADEEQASDAEIAAGWEDEIKRRLDEIDAGAVELISHEEFLAQLDAHIASKRKA